MEPKQSEGKEPHPIAPQTPGTAGLVFNGDNYAPLFYNSPSSGSQLLIQSPGATQSADTLLGTEPQQLVREAIRQVLLALNDIVQDETNREAIRTEAAAVEKLLDSPKPKMSTVRALLGGIKDELTKLAATSAATWVASKATDCVSLLTQAIAGIGGPSS